MLFNTINFPSDLRSVKRSGSWVHRDDSGKLLKFRNVSKSNKALFTEISGLIHVQQKDSQSFMKQCFER